MTVACKEPEIKISVILPVYNVEGYIDACIASLQAQTLRELEFIFVDDCGTDNSMKTVEEWAAVDERVRIICNEGNIGVGPSRNKGIELARGEYLSFVDPDDWLAPDFYELLFNKTGNGDFDIVKGVRTMVSADRMLQPKKQLKSIINYQIHKSQRHHIPLYCVFTYEHQSAIYRHSIFDDPFVRYGTSKNAQDTTFLLRVGLSTPTIALEKKAIYYYCQRDSSATAAYSKTRAFAELLSFKEKMDSISRSPHASLTDKKYIQRYLVNILSGYFANACLSRKREEWKAEDERLYVRLLEEELKRLDIMFSQSDHLKHCAELKAIREYDCWISTVNRMPGFFNGDRLNEWAELLIGNPYVEDCYIKGFSQAIAHSLLEYAAHRNAGSTIAKPLHFVRQKLNLLSPNQRRDVIYHLPSSFMLFIIRKLKTMIYGFAK